MQKIINRLIDESVVNVDKYVNNGSTWLIFTETKQWVIELTKDGTLWYNYNFFKNLFAYMSMDVVENQQYVTKWVEDNVINGSKKVKTSPFVAYLGDDDKIEDTIQNGIKETSFQTSSQTISVEDTIQNGVKQTRLFRKMKSSVVEDTLKNGVKITYSGGDVCRNDSIEDTIENGIKETELHKGVRPSAVENTIQNGIKETKSEVATREWKAGEVINNGVKEISFFETDRDSSVQNVIQNGIKETKPINEWVNSESIVEKTIQGGIKETKTPGDDGDLLSTMEWMEENETNSVPKLIDYVIKHGVKETISEEHHRLREVVDTLKSGIKEVQPLPAQDGNMDYSNYYYRQGDRTIPHTQYVKDVIENGEKQTLKKST